MAIYRRSKRTAVKRRQLATFKRPRRYGNRRVVKGARGVITKRQKGVNVRPVLRAAIKKVVRSQVEVKQIVAVTTATAQNGATFATFPLLTDVVQGDADNQRTGEEIRPYSLKLRYLFTNTTSSTIYIRMVVIKAKTITGSANPTAASLIFQDDTQNPTSFTTFTTTPYKLITHPLSAWDFTPCYSKVWKLAASTSTDAMDQQWCTAYIPCAGKVRYTGATAGPLLADHRWTVLFFGYCSNTTALLTTWTVNGTSVFSYYDA